MPRFLLVAGTVRDKRSHPAWPDGESPLVGDPSPDGAWVSWRLTGDNHRELGRSVPVFPNSGAAIVAIDQLRGAINSLESLVVPSAKDGRWTWRMTVGDELVATSGRPYARHRECVYNLEAFIGAVPGAEIAESPARRRQERAQRLLHARNLISGGSVRVVRLPDHSESDRAEYAG